MKPENQIRALLGVAAGVAVAGSVPAPAAPAYFADDARPVMLMQDPNESIYQPPGPPRLEEGVNAGGVNFELEVSYLTDYVYRGVDQSERLSSLTEDGAFDPDADVGAEDAPNLQFNGSIKLNLNRLPHPVAGVFVNVYNDDPISRFQEIRPYFGFDWDLRPLRVQGGQISYIFPEREDLNTQEVWLSVTFDDSRLWRTERPILAPYGYVAYDYDLYDGLYFEMGVRHEMVFEDTGMTLAVVADIAYVLNNEQFGPTDPLAEEREDTGFHHYDVGLIGTYSLNRALGIPQRYGNWALVGYLYYTDALNEGLNADTQMWGGAAIRFRY
ncbi:MAG TPA: hypothetical protein VFB66_08545 [Tepidisphaeraceae bacterium]|nr:hypothetical protein [Tepidisphaeraceae bacterium]